MSDAMTFWYASNPVKQRSSVTLYFAARAGSLLTLFASCSRHRASRSAARSPRATISTPSAARMQSFAAPVPRPPHPMTPTRITSDPATCTPPGHAIAAAAAAVVWTNVRRDTGTISLSLILASGSRFHDETKSYEWPIGEPPSALRKLRVPLSPRIVLNGPRVRSDVLDRIAKRSTARDERAIHHRDPFSRVAEQVEQSECIGASRGDRVRSRRGVAAMPDERVAPLRRHYFRSGCGRRSARPF